MAKHWTDKYIEEFPEGSRNFGRYCAYQPGKGGNGFYYGGFDTYEEAKERVIDFHKKLEESNERFRQGVKEGKTCIRIL